MTVDIVFLINKDIKTMDNFLYTFILERSVQDLKKYDLPSIKDIREKRDGRVLN